MKTNRYMVMALFILFGILALQSQVLDKANGWEVIFSDDFEADFGWPKWKVQTDAGDYTWGRVTSNVYAGNYSLWCAKENLNGAPKLNPLINNYGALMDTWAILYDPVDLTNCTNAELVFYIWHRMEPNDYLEVLADVGNHNLQGYTYNGNSNGWEEKRLSLKKWPVHGNMCGFKYVFVTLHFKTDLDGATDKGVFIDNFYIQKYTAGKSDLGCSSFTASPVNQIPGGLINVTGTINNTGDGSSIATTIHYYLSENTSIDPDNDYLLGFSTIPALNASGETAIDEYLLLPASVVSSQYYIGYVIDKDNLTDDDNTVNNTNVYSTPITFIQTSIEHQPGLQPENPCLFSNYPNPFNASTVLPFYLPESGLTHIEIYNIQGRKIATLLDENMDSGFHRIFWNPQSEPTGIYFCYLKTAGTVEIRKLVLNK